MSERPSPEPARSLPPLAVVGPALGAAALHVHAQAWAAAAEAPPEYADRLRFVLAVRDGERLAVHLGLAGAAAVAAWLIGRARPGARAVLGGLAAGVAPALLWSGTGGGAPSTLGLASAFATAAATAALLLLLGRVQRPAAGRLLGALGLVVAIAVAADRARIAAAPPTVTSATVVHDLTDGGVHWEVLEERADGPVHVAMITPTREPRLDSVDLPTIVLPPPAAVAFEVPDAPGPLWLELRAGAAAEAGRGEQRARVAFDVLVDGEPRWSHERMLLENLPPERRSWTVAQDDGLAPGLAVEPGQQIELRTRLVQWDARGGDPAPIEAGFGRVRIVRRGPTPMRAASAERPNVVFVVADTQRRDRLSAYGYERPTSPHLDRLAARGLLFEHAWATSSWTWPSTASLFTGRSILEHGVRDAPSAYLAAELTTIAEALRADGYRTAAFSGNPLVAARRNYDQGFEVFDDHPLDFRQGAELVDGALAWLASIPHERFFLYLHLVDSHDPYRPDPREVERLGLTGRPDDWRPNHESRLRERLILSAQRSEDGVPDVAAVVTERDRLLIDELYDGATATTDRHFGRVLDELDRLGLRESTIVVFTADHGEQLFERGFLGHGLTLFDEEVGVPLVVAGPGVPRGERRTDPVSNRHLAPTLAARLGLGFPTAGVTAELFDAPTGLDPGVLAGSDHAVRRGHRSPTWALRVGDEVVHWTPTAEGPPRFAAHADIVALYDLAADPGAERDLAAERPERTAELVDELRARLASDASRATVTALGAGDATLEMLRRAGYIEPEEDP